MLFVSTIYTNQQTICYLLQTIQIVHHIKELFCLPKEKDIAPLST